MNHIPNCPNLCNKKLPMIIKAKIQTTHLTKANQPNKEIL